MKKIHIEYYSLLREQAGKAQETVTTDAETAGELFTELSEAYGFTLPVKRLRVAVNDEFSEWDTPLGDGSTLVFIPPVAGG